MTGATPAGSAATAPGDDIIVQAQQLWQRVSIHGGTLDILKGIDLEIKRGESVAIVGASGSGKTTLLGMLAGLDTPSSGRVFMAGHDLTAMNEEERARLRGQYVGFIFQNFQLLPALTALENVMLPLELRRDKSDRETAMALLEQVGLGDRAVHYPRQLSGGEQQRVAIARAFASQPPVLFADEPTGNLDTQTGRTIEDLLFRLNREYQTTLVLVTHDPQLASHCGRTCVMDAGALTSEPQPA
ncbi:ABC transporter ATP-binding protein [Natronospirillum operosum]|uniref:ABC transporter ATP-binding protein n=1 Tax=Natronospirillum operosum TaxID=2759953 RepID=A0A4Z0W6X2_9GAMM|nr:ABC transporter ATP-binding protein [Natronospirillum operosum]TGG92955.1 ABC transporter ATP-binding protein [Natronospirillum operosum]